MRDYNRSITCGLIILGALLMIAATIGDARAHDLWTNDQPVPPWVKSACCGAKDAHNLPREAVHMMRDGYVMDGWDEVIPFAKTQPSPDDSYWIFYNRENGAHILYCVFVPVGSM
jgi:hypothetical protein